LPVVVVAVAVAVVVVIVIVVVVIVVIVPIRPVVFNRLYAQERNEIIRLLRFWYRLIIFR